MNKLTRRAAGIGVIGLVLGAAAAFAQSPSANPPVRLRATVEKRDGNTLSVKLAGGQDATVALADNAKVLGIVKTTIADVKVGDYIGISSMPQADGTEKAIHVHIFPEAMRGVAEGHFPWDNRPGSMMTNGTLETTVASNDGQTLTVKYKGNEKKVVVPPDAVIVKYVPADKAELKPGAKIFIAAAQKRADGTLAAGNVSVGLNGLTPPM